MSRHWLQGFDTGVDDYLNENNDNSGYNSYDYNGIVEYKKNEMSAYKQMYENEHSMCNELRARCSYLERELSDCEFKCSLSKNSNKSMQDSIKLLSTKNEHNDVMIRSLRKKVTTQQEIITKNELRIKDLSRDINFGILQNLRILPPDIINVIHGYVYAQEIDVQAGFEELPFYDVFD